MTDEERRLLVQDIISALDSREYTAKTRNSDPKNTFRWVREKWVTNCYGGNVSKSVLARVFTPYDAWNNIYDGARKLTVKIMGYSNTSRIRPDQEQTANAICDKLLQTIYDLRCKYLNGEDIRP